MAERAKAQTAAQELHFTANLKNCSAPWSHPSGEAQSALRDIFYAREPTHARSSTPQQHSSTAKASEPTKAENDDLQHELKVDVNYGRRRKLSQS